MCLLLLIFVVPALILMGAPFFALVWGATALFISIQTKRLGQTKQLSKEELKTLIKYQIVYTYILMIFAFIIYLAIRYAMT